MTQLCIGIDLGGTKIEAAAFDRYGCELNRLRVSTPQGDYEGTIRAIHGLVVRLETELGGKGSVGIGTPGTLSTTGVMKNSNSQCLIGRPLKEDLEHALGRPIRMANDANCFALSEAIDGTSAGASVVFGTILGTGVGGGIVVDGRVLVGCNGIAGEWGHNPLPWPKADELPGTCCYCGKSGCIETFLSGPAMSRDHREKTGQSLTPATIVDLARAGDPPATRTLERYEDRLARALAHVINVLDPDVVVLSGGMSNIMRLYDNIPRLWGKQVFSDRVDTVLSAAKYGDSSGVRGAAWLWKE